MRTLLQIVRAGLKHYRSSLFIFRHNARSRHFKAANIERWQRVALGKREVDQNAAVGDECHKIFPQLSLEISQPKALVKFHGSGGEILPPRRKNSVVHRDLLIVQTRNRVPAILTRLGYAPVIQEIFGTERTELDSQVAQLDLPVRLRRFPCLWETSDCQ
jgi:hypothetical protein